jgi:hypothetical protein
VALICQWLKEFYTENEQVPPHPLYPFNESRLRELGRSKPTVRSVLKWCADNFTGVEIHPVEPYFQNELANVETSIDSLIDDEVALANALKVAFKSLIGKTAEEVTIEAVEKIKAGAADRGYIDFKIIGNQGKVKIGIDVLQQSGGQYVVAALRRLIDYQKFDLTRGCLVRSKKINSSATVARECLRKLLKEQGGEWVMLQNKDIKPLLAISSVYYNSTSYQLTEEQIFDFIQQKKLAINNPLVREILSDPSGQEPNNLTNDDLPCSIPQCVIDPNTPIDLST